MPLPNTLAAYVDIEEALLELEERDSFPAQIHFKTSAQAIRWRLRANNYRKLLRATEAAKKGLPSGTSRFDRFVFKLPKTGSTLTVDLEERNDLHITYGDDP